MRHPPVAEPPQDRGPIRAWGWLLAVAGPLIFAAVNVWTRLHDQTELATQGRVWEVWTWETSSAVATLLLIPLVGGLTTSIGGRRAHAVWVAPAAAAFVIAHIAIFVALRSLIYALAGSRYVFGGAASWLYEAPKDLVTFAVTSAILWIARDTVFEVSPPAPLEFRDGDRRHRVALAAVVAVEAAGNYVWVHVADGRRLFVRETLGSVQRRTGLPQAHRTWLVNPSHVLSHAPRQRGRGKTLNLAGGLSAPLSPRSAEGFLCLLN